MTSVAVFTGALAVICAGLGDYGDAAAAGVVCLAIVAGRAYQRRKDQR